MTLENAKKAVQEGKIKFVLDFLQEKFRQNSPRENELILPKKFLEILQKDLDKVVDIPTTLKEANPLNANVYKERVLVFLALKELDSYWGNTPPPPIPWWLIALGVIFGSIFVTWLNIPSSTSQEGQKQEKKEQLTPVEYVQDKKFRFNDIVWQHQEHEKIKWLVSICTKDNKCEQGRYILEKKSKQDIEIQFPNIDIENEKYAYFVIDWVVNAQVIKTDTIPCPPLEKK
jgi:hypothetical protein